jgi:hypothetical protein
MENAFRKKNNQFLRGPDPPPTQPNPWTRPTLAPLSATQSCGPTHCYGPLVGQPPLSACCVTGNRPQILCPPRRCHATAILLFSLSHVSMPSHLVSQGAAHPKVFPPSCKIIVEAPSFSSPTADVAPPHSTCETCLLHRHAALARRCTRDLAERLQPISRNLTAKTFSFFHRCRAFGGRATVATYAYPTSAERPVSALA